MDATMLAVIGTGLTAVGVGVALFAALWRVQGNRFDTLELHMRERFELAENTNRERFEAMDRRWTERFEAMDRRFETAERRNEAAHAAICESIAKLDERTRADAAALHHRFDERFDALNGRFDDLYRHLPGPGTQTGQPGPAPAAG